MRRFGFLTVLLFAFPFFVSAADEIPSTFGKPIGDFTLTDFRGKEVSLSDFKESKLVVVAFLGTDCPLAKLYGPRLQEMSQRYVDKGVAFLGINANRQDTLTHIGAYARRSEITFPILKDGGNKVADLLQAQRTPEVFLLDDDRNVRYWGRIDDEFGIGFVKEFEVHYYLTDAIDNLLAGKPVATAAETSVGCIIGRVREVKADSPVTYSKDIAPIFNAHCIECHREGEIGPFALTNFEETLGWAEMIREVVNDKRMPPWHADPQHGKFQNDISLSKDEIAKIDLWVRNGAPEGNPKDLPPLPTFTPGWQLPREPDVVVAMSDQPFPVKAEGQIRYQYFDVDPGFTEDKFITAAEIVPSNRSVVHHVLIFVVPPEKRTFLGAGGGEFLVGYVPGMRVEPLPAGMAKMVPAGSKLKFQVHYTPNGTAQEDLTRVGFVFAKPEEVDHIVITQNAVNPKIKIPPREDSYRSIARSGNSPIAVKLLTLMPHMHLRGKSFSYEAVFPDGTREMLLNVPEYDFNWQTSYRLAEPREFPVGSHIECVAYHDNSERNPANPNPDEEVRWGDQTDEEMMIGYFDVAVPVEVFGDQIPTDLMRRKPADRAREFLSAALFKGLDANSDGVLELDELKDEKHKHAFPKVDVDGDGKITLEELETGLLKLRRR